MTRFVLVPGAGGDGRYWDRVLPLLPDAVALDLPPDAEGFDDYVSAVAEILPDEPAVLVGQSMGAFTVALVAESGHDIHLARPEPLARIVIDFLREAIAA